MKIRTRGILFALGVAALAGCAAQGGSDGMGGAAPSTAAQTAPAPMPGRGHMGMGMCMPGQGMAAASPAQLAQVDERMRSMQEAHAKMMAAKTPEERRALMAEHQKAMREGMAAMHATVGPSPCMGPEMMQRHRGMMQMMMQMMAETPEAPAPAPVPK